jgi:hypothetical protein
MASLKRNGIIYFLVLAAILASSLPASASAYFWKTGNDLVKCMREYERKERQEPRANTADASLYLGFVIGVHDGLAGDAFCTPEQTAQGQICAVVARYLNAHPEEWNKPAWLLVATALKQAFPCKK